MDQRDLAALERATHNLRAAGQQGLVELAGALLERGHMTDLENTGGYCMALVYGVGDDVLVAAGEGNGTYYVSRYPRSVWDEAPDETRDTSDFDPEGATVYGLDDAVARWFELA